MSFIISLEKYLEEPGITGVNVPECITKILNEAIPKGVTSVVIPKSVTEIESMAFSDAEDLLSITVDADNPNYCDIDGVLYSKDKTTLLCYPQGRQDTEFVIPDYVTKIGYGAFCGCGNLTSVVFPDHLTEIGIDAFFACGLTSIDLPTNLELISTYAFSCCHALTSVDIPKGVTKILSRTFVGCKNLRSVRIPRSVTQIDKQVFDGCNKLQWVEIPESVVDICDDAFENCKCLKIVTPHGSYAEEFAQTHNIKVSNLNFAEDIESMNA